MKITVIMVFIFSAAALYAVLPRNAEFRRKDVFEYRERKQLEYQQAEQIHEEKMVAGDQAARKALAVSPYSAGNGTINAKNTGDVASVQRQTVSAPHSRKWLASLIALLLMGGGAFWVHKVTEPDRRSG